MNSNCFEPKFFPQSTDSGSVPFPLPPWGIGNMAIRHPNRPHNSSELLVKPAGIVSQTRRVFL